MEATTTFCERTVICMTLERSERDYGIDLLRLFAMGLIILHHLLSHGGLMFAFSDFAATGIAVHLLNAFARCAVNAYALISGYVMVASRFRPSRLIALWLQVLFYGVLAVVCLPLMGASASIGDWLDALFPITHNNYWYFTCYVPVFLFSPFLNKLLHGMNQRQNRLMTTALIVLFSLMPTISLGDLFQLNDGYHFVWLMVLYLMGGSIRLHGFGWLKNKAVAAITFVICGLLGWACRLGMIAIGASKLHELLLAYTSPTMLLCGLSLLSLFQGLKLPQRICQLIAVLSPLSFGVYLIHDNPLVREHLVISSTASLAGFSPLHLLLALAGCWAGVYAVCLLMEYLRTRLFVLLRIPALCTAAEKRLLHWSANDSLDINR